jgi:hypothetical protein
MELKVLYKGGIKSYKKWNLICGMHALMIDIIDNIFFLSSVFQGDRSSQRSWWNTPLHLALESGSEFKLVDYLLPSGADPKAANKVRGTIWLAVLVVESVSI